jgi:hypothetical protein
MDIASLVNKCVQPVKEPAQGVLPQGGFLSAELLAKLAEFLRHLPLLAQIGFDPTIPHFRAEWLSILNLVFGRGDSPVVLEAFSHEELEAIHQYREQLAREVNQLMVSGHPTIGPDDGRGIPDEVRNRIWEEHLTYHDQVRHMWDNIAGLGGVLVPGVAPTAPPAARPIRPIPGIQGKPPTRVSPLRPEGELLVDPRTPPRTASNPTAAGIGESMVKPDRRAELNVDMALQEYRDKNEYRHGSGREVEAAHMGPSSALREVAGYSRSRALTALLPRESHQAFDRYWERWSREQVGQGRSQARVDEFLRVLKEAAESVPELRGRTADTMGFCFENEFFQVLNLKPEDTIRIPYAK